MVGRFKDDRRILARSALTRASGVPYNFCPYRKGELRKQRTGLGFISFPGLAQRGWLC